MNFFEINFDVLKYIEIDSKYHYSGSMQSLLKYFKPNMGHYFDAWFSTFKLRQNLLNIAYLSF